MGVATLNLALPASSGFNSSSIEFAPTRAQSLHLYRFHIELPGGGGGVLNFELGTDVRPGASTTTL